MQASELIPLIDTCCADVLDSMYFTSIAEIKHHVEAPLPQEISFGLRFDGDLQGRFILGLSKNLARSLAANFLGEEEDLVSLADLEEVSGELANMLCGSIVSRIGGGKFALSHPEPVDLVAQFDLPGDDRVSASLTTDAGELHLSLVFDRRAVPAGGDA